MRIKNIYFLEITTNILLTFYCSSIAQIILAYRMATQNEHLIYVLSRVPWSRYSIEIFFPFKKSNCWSFLCYKKFFYILGISFDQICILEIFLQVIYFVSFEMKSFNFGDQIYQCFILLFILFLCYP